MRFWAVVFWAWWWLKALEKEMADFIGLGGFSPSISLSGKFCENIQLQWFSEKHLGPRELMKAKFYRVNLIWDQKN